MALAEAGISLPRSLVASVAVILATVYAYLFLQSYITF